MISPLVRRLVAPNPSPMTGAGTNTYLAGHGDVAVIDPGPADPAHVEAILAALQGERVGRVLVTHSHPDHAPGATLLAQRTGAPVLGIASPSRAQGHRVRDGQAVAGGGATIEVIHTPGHALDHACFLLREERSLFSGDLIASGTTVVIAPPDGDMATYMDSLRRLRRRRIRRIYPGHGEVIEDPQAAIEEYIQHRRMRERQVLGALRDRPATIEAIVSRIYADVPAALHPLAARSVHAHLIKLRAEGKVSGTDPTSEWRLT